MKKTLAERVKQILDELDISQVKIAEMTGCTRGAVNQLVSLTPNCLVLYTLST